MMNKVIKCLAVMVFVLGLAGCTNCIGVTFTNNTQIAVKVLSVKTDSSKIEYVDDLGIVQPGQTAHFNAVFPRGFPEFRLRIKDISGKEIREIRANGDAVRSKLVQNSWTVSL